MRGARGAVTPLVAGGAVSFVIVALMLQVVGVAVVAHRRAAAAADLAALAGAAAIQRGHDGCDAATSTALANGATLASCAVAGQTIEVRVECAAPPMFGRDLVAAAMAKAGPT